MAESDFLQKSTERLKGLFDRASAEDLAVLVEYNFGKDSGPVDASELVDEVLSNGSNSIRNYIGHKVDYLTIVRDVADKIGVEWNNSDDEEQIEKRILAKVFQQAWDRMSNAEREPITKRLAEQGLSNINAQLVEGTFFQFLPSVSYLVTWNVARIIAASIARQLGVEAVGAFAEGLGGLLLGPVGALIGVAIVLNDIAGPAYRKTIPSVLQIAYIRQKNNFLVRKSINN